RTVTVKAGEDVAVDFDRPAPRVAAPLPPSPRVQPQDGPGRGLPRSVFVVGLGVTAALGGVAVWSGLDTGAAHDAYGAPPTQQGWDDGRAKQLRTTLLIAGTATAGLATVAVALFWTNWHPGDGRGQVAISVAPTVGDGATLGVAGRF